MIKHMPRLAGHSQPLFKVPDNVCIGGVINSIYNIYVRTPACTSRLVYLLMRSEFTAPTCQQFVLNGFNRCVKDLQRGWCKTMVRNTRRVTKVSYLGTGTPTSAAFLTTSPRITSTSIGRFASRSTSIDGLKPLDFVCRMRSAASSSNESPV